MLSLSNVSVDMASSYFEKDDYYSSEDGPEKPEFFGNSAKILGLSSEFDPEIFRNLLNGLSPDGSSQLIQVQSKGMTTNELEKVRNSFNRRTQKLQVPEGSVAFIRSSVLGKAEQNRRHFTQQENRTISAEVMKYISLLKIDSESKQGLKKASEQLIKSLSKSAHRAALDCTFSAPKSVSIACLVGGRNELLEAHKVAVDEALRFIETRAAGTRIGAKNNRHFIRTGNVIGAKFHHGTSREGDPQLHTHCVIMNMTQRDKNNWRAMHTDPIYQHSKLAGLIYQNKLAELVQKKGYAIEVKSNGTFEIKGYSEQDISVFSKRRKQVVENSAKVLFDDMKRNNLIPDGATFENFKSDLIQRVTQKMNRISVTIDRQVKSEIKAETLKVKWTAEAKEAAIKHPKPAAQRSLWGSKLDQTFGKDHLIERKSVIKKLDLIIQNLSKNLGRATSHEIAKASLQDLSLSTSIQETNSLVSLSHASKEAEILRISTKGIGKFDVLIRQKHRRNEAKLGLTEDQKNALDVTVRSKDQVLIWDGVAGAGKTWALKHVKESAVKNGYKVIALAPDSSSSSTLGRELGISSSTVHSFLKNTKTNKRTLLIVDEAGKFSTKLMHDLLKKIEKTGARLILSGDHRQLGAVEAGNPYKALLKSNVNVINLTESVRQKVEPLKAAVSAVASQRPEAIKWAAGQLKDKIVERKTLAARINAVVRSYESMGPEDRKNTLFIADTNHERSLLTAQLREKKRAFGELGTKEGELKILVARDLTEAQKRCSEYFERGDILVTNARSSTLSPGKLYGVSGIKNGKLLVQDGLKKVVINPAAEQLSVYKLQVIKIAEKDKLEWRRNHSGHENREEVEVKRLSKDSAVLEKKSGETVKINLKVPQFIDYAHVSTTYSSQGKTADKVVALTQSNTSRESFYVAISRARNDVQIITDNKDNLVKRALKSSSKDIALEHIEIPKWQPKNEKTFVMEKS